MPKIQLLRKLDEIDSLLKKGVLSRDRVVVLSTDKKSWYVRFQKENDAEVLLELQRGGERKWSDPRAMFEFCLDHWGISHAKVELRWAPKKL